MTDTAIEKIKNFNEASKQKQLDKEKIQPKPEDNASKTAREKVKEKAEEKPKTAEQLAQEQKELEEQQRNEQLDAVKQLTDATSTIIDRVNERVNPLKDWIASQPTPGGIASVLVFIGFFVLAVMPVNAQGQTRLYLLWQTILNRTHMKYTEGTQGARGDFGNASQSQPAGSIGASGNFGGGAPTQADIAQEARNNGQMLLDVSHLNIFGSSE